MTDLLPCPFCGGEAVAYYDRKEHPNSKFYSVAKAYCTHALCGIGLERWADSPDEAVERAVAAWNTRSLTAAAVYGYQAAERTCTFSSGHNGNETEKMVLPRCSACGEEVDGYMCDMYADLGGGVVLEYPYRYCPNCGARVLEG